MRAGTDLDRCYSVFVLVFKERHTTGRVLFSKPTTKDDLDPNVIWSPTAVPLATRAISVLAFCSVHKISASSYRCQSPSSTAKTRV